MSFPSLSFNISTIRFAIKWKIPINGMQSGVSMGPGPSESNRKSHLARSMEKALCREVSSEGPLSDEDSNRGIHGFQDDMRPQDCKPSEKRNKPDPEHQLLR